SPTAAAASRSLSSATTTCEVERVCGFRQAGARASATFPGPIEFNYGGLNVHGILPGDEAQRRSLTPDEKRRTRVQSRRDHGRSRVAAAVRSAHRTKPHHRFERLAIERGCQKNLHDTHVGETQDHFSGDPLSGPL